MEQPNPTMKTILELNGLGDEGLNDQCAILLGWKCFPYAVINGTRYDMPAWVSPRHAETFNPERPHGGFSVVYNNRPNWTQDLNACSEFEKGLSEVELNTYCDHLASICKSIVKIITATPRQRTIAFILTKSN